MKLDPTQDTDNRWDGPDDDDLPYPFADDPGDDADDAAEKTREVGEER